MYLEANASGLPVVGTHNSKARMQLMMDITAF